MATEALARVKDLPGLFRSQEAHDVGLHWRDLYRLRDEGVLLELSRGLYRLAELPALQHQDFVVVCTRAPQGMICLDSALAHWDLSDEIPSEVHLAVPRGSHRPSIDYPPTKVHVFSAANFELGRERGGPEGEEFFIASRERSVVDAFRCRRLLGEQAAYDALRRYLAQPRPQPGLLVEMARELRAEASVTAALRMLLP